MVTVTLRQIDESNREAVLALRVTPEQEEFVASVERSFEDAAERPDQNPMMRAIYAGDTPVGFLMLADPGHDDETGDRRYFLWRFLVAADQQRHGYGRAALAALIDYVRTRPTASKLLTSAVAGDGAPYDFYLRCGFQPTGAIDGNELVLEFLF